MILAVIGYVMAGWFALREIEKSDEDAVEVSPFIFPAILIATYIGELVEHITGGGNED